MPASPIQSVKIAFDAATLDATPSWTALETLAGVHVQSWTVSRGRSSELEKTGTGSATVKLIDEQGLLDPTNGSSTYYGKIQPDKQAQILLYDPVAAELHSVFRGFVESWDYTLDVTERFFVVEIGLVDGFAILNDMELMPGQDGDPVPAGSEGNVFYEDSDPDGSVDDRIFAILDDVGWPAGLSEIFSGNVRVQETKYAPGTQALAALFDAADAEFPEVANLYMSKDGILTFHGRQPRFRPDVAAYGINRRDVADPSVTIGDPTVCPISELSFSLTKEQIYNSVLASPQGIADADIGGQLSEDATSITARGKKSLSFPDLLTLEGIATSNDAKTETKLFADYYKDNYAVPSIRVNRMVFKSRMPSDPLADPLWKMLTRVEISDLLTLTTAHPGGGGFASVGYFVEGIRYDCQPLNTAIPNVTLELDVSPQALYDTNPFDSDTDPA